MTKAADLTVKILEQIRDGIRTTNERLDQTRTELSERLDQVSGRVDQVSERLDLVARRQTEGEVRLATELVALAGAVGRTNELLRERLDDRDRIDDIEKRLQILERVAAKH